MILLMLSGTGIDMNTSIEVAFKNDPGLCQLTEIALKGFLAEKFKKETNLSDTAQQDQDIQN